MAKNTASDVANKMNNPLAMSEFSNFEEEQLSFPPYWDAGEGKWFYGMVVDLDSRDPQFPRYLVQAEKEILCHKGKKDEQEEVTVKPGEFFTLGAYGLLPLDRYVGVRVLVHCIGKKDIGQPQKAWDFKLFVSPEDKKLLLTERKERALTAARIHRENRMRQLTAGTNGQQTADAPPFG